MTTIKGVCLSSSMKKIDLLAALFVIVGTLALFYNINKPFWGQFDWAGAWFGTIARNYWEIGIIKTKLAPITVAGTQNPAEWSYYNHYPILFPLLVSLSGALFGFHEWSIRLVPIIFSGGLLLALYMLSRRFSPLLGIFGIASLLVTPMYLYYGKLPIHEQAVLFFSTLAVYFYLSWRQQEKSSYYTLLVATICLAFLTSWTGAYILILITLHFFLTSKVAGKDVKKFLLIYLILGLLAVMHLAHIYWTSSFKEFQVAFSERTSGGVEGAKILFTPAEFVTKQAKWFLSLYTKPLALVSLLTLIAVSITSALRKKTDLEFQILVLFLLLGFFQWIFISRIVWIHDYMLIYFFPFVFWASGYFFYKALSFNKFLGILAFIVLIISALYTSLPFTKALIESKDQTSEIYPVALFIRDHTISGERILVAPVQNSDFELHYPRHYFSFYTDRFTQYQFLDLDSWQKEKTFLAQRYRYIILPENYSDRGLKSKLDTTYQTSLFTNFRVYNLSGGLITPIAPKAVDNSFPETRL